MHDFPINISGCEQCLPSSAEAAWKDRRIRTAELIDESHYHVMILACPECGQRFLWVFTEMIDWVNGDDAQYWTVLPITESEAVELTRRASELTEGEINKLGSGRRSLFRDYPTGGSPREFWGRGIMVGPHD